MSDISQGDAQASYLETPQAYKISSRYGEWPRKAKSSTINSHTPPWDPTKKASNQSTTGCVIHVQEALFGN